MLTQLILENFKCFESLHLPLASLTLLTGFNSAGKSTVLQALGALHQTSLESEWSNELLLNASKVALGSVKDVVNDTKGGRGFSIGLETEQLSCSWTLESLDRNSLTIPIQHIVWKAFNSENNEWRSQDFDILMSDQESPPLRNLLPQRLVAESRPAQQLGILIRDLEYISAERSGPRDTYPANSNPREKSVGLHGEKAPWVLYHNAEDRPLEGLILTDIQPTLQRQAEAWLRTFFPGVRLEINPVLRTNLVTLGLRMADQEEFRRPQNVGYGLTHVLPILTACLVASKGKILLIENPEAHLHPSGQSMMGRFLARAAAAGLQVIVETHSDHILNGVRLAVRGNLIPAKSVSLNFFIQKDNKASVLSPKVDERGSINDWPQGFFDQLEMDLMELI